jgi:hypothetical protein
MVRVEFEGEEKSRVVGPRWCAQDTRLKETFSLVRYSSLNKLTYFIYCSEHNVIKKQTSPLCGESSDFLLASLRSSSSIVSGSRAAHPVLRLRLLLSLLLRRYYYYCLNYFEVHSFYLSINAPAICKVPYY